jgi:uncharacterized protein
MKILISGSSGLVGSSVVFNLVADGHQVYRLVRTAQEDGIVWDPLQPIRDIQPYEGFDGVIHLAGENIFGKWTEEKKRAIRESRVQSTRYLSEALASLTSRPRILICASASGYYGDRGAEVLREDSPPGQGFLAEVCKEWEAATQPAIDKGIRVANLRFGIILSKKGGALHQMLTPFKLGGGAKLGSGEQWWSWIDLDDVVGVIEYCLNSEPLQGPINTATPNPVSNAEFTKTLARVLHRPAILRIPKSFVRRAMGEMANELLFCSFRMEPAKLIAAGYTFAYPDLDSSLRHQLT